jgi:hypothetical protein
MRIDVARIGLLDRLNRAIRIHRIAKLLGRFEEGNALGRNIDLGAGLRIAAGPGIALPRPETAEATNLNLVPGLQGSDYRVEECIDDYLSVATGEVPDRGDLVYEVSFCHDMVPFVLGEGYRAAAKSILLVDYRRDDSE